MRKTRQLLEGLAEALNEVRAFFNDAQDRQIAPALYIETRLGLMFLLELRFELGGYRRNFKLSRRRRSSTP